METPIAARLRTVFAAGALCLALASAARAEPADAPRLDAHFDATVARYQPAGIALGVIVDGEVVHVRTAGETVAGSGRPITRRSLFKIASLSKAMTTALLARLADAGRLAWDDPVTKHLPALRMHDPWVTRELQLRDLLIHNSGLRLGAGDLMLWPEPNDFGRADVIAALAHLRPVHSFRARYAYDNILYIVAGEVAAAAGGAPYEDLMRREVFAPLGMNCEAGAFDRRAHGDVAQPHIRVDGRNVVARADGDTVPASTSAAAGGIRCSLDDLLAWMQAWLAPDARRRAWLSDAQREALWTPQMPLPLGPQTRAWEGAQYLAYGYGWRLSDAHGEPKVAHTGTLAGMYAVLTLLPRRRSGWVILINGNGGDARTVLNQVLLQHYTAPTRRRSVAHYARQIERAQATVAVSAGASPAARTPASAGDADVPLGIWRDPWFGEVSICTAGTRVEFRARRSPRLLGALRRAGDGLLVDWDDPSVDAEPWLHRSADGQSLTLTHVDPAADFSYDYDDLRFARVRDCD